MINLKTIFVFALGLLAGCVGADNPLETATDLETATHTSVASDGSDSTTANDTSNDAPCEALFGLPNAKTGLSAQQCMPSCTCEGKDFTPPTYTEEDIQRLESLELLNPFPDLTEDPYDHPEEHVPSNGAVCGVTMDQENPNGYWLTTYDSEQAAELAGAQLTHRDACGLCSPLINLAVYMRRPDLTDPVRKCGLSSALGGAAANIKCLQKLGFDYPCAQIWYYNTAHTESKCLAVCLAALNKPYHNPDGSLNDCLQCDETKSGDVFKAVAGRTRRNTGLPSSMCRPCAEVVPVVHDYN